MITRPKEFDSITLPDAVLEYITRIESALAFIEQECINDGPELYPVGPENIEWEDDGNTIKRVVGPWIWNNYKGDTFIDALEAAMKFSGWIKE